MGNQRQLYHFLRRKDIPKNVNWMVSSDYFGKNVTKLTDNVRRVNEWKFSHSMVSCKGNIEMEDEVL